MIRVLVTSCLLGSVLSKSCESLPNQNTNKTLNGKDRISSFFSPGHCLAVDAKMNAADLHGSANAKLYWADCRNVADDSKTPLTLTHKRKSVQVVVAEFQHFSVKRKNKLQHGFSLIKLKDGYKKDRCISVSGFSDISKGVRLQLSRCDKKNAKMRFTGHAAGLWVYKNKKRSDWCLWPPMKTGDTAKVGACISGLLGGRKSAPVNGNWATWAKSGSCSKTCGAGGKQKYTRTCTNPAPAHGGTDCTDAPGSKEKSESCNTNIKCPVNGNWAVWSKSGECSATCGAGGKQKYTRTCTNPAPAHGGTDCTDSPGSKEKSVSCNTNIKCPVHGSWTVWIKNGTCSGSCGDNGKQQYNRTCSNPKPAHGGDGCTGSTGKLEPCNTNILCPKPVHGQWSAWSKTGYCSSPCNWWTGKQIYNRTCSNPAPAHGGNKCAGESGKTRSCNTHGCTGKRFVMGESNTTINGYREIESVEDLRDNYVAFRYFYNATKGIPISKTWYAGNCCTALKNGQKLKFDNKLIFPSSNYPDVEVQCHKTYTQDAYMGLGAVLMPEEFKFTSANACGELRNNQAIFVHKW